MYATNNMYYIWKEIEQKWSQTKQDDVRDSSYLNPPKIVI